MLHLRQFAISSLQNGPNNHTSRYRESVKGKHICVQITQASACSSCVAKKMCNSSESKEKLVDIVSSEAFSYRVGEEVLLTGSVEMGLTAVFWAYGAPLLLLMAVLLATLQVTTDEPLAALMALASLAGYYGVLYLNKNRLTRKFSFTIKHIK